LVSVSQLIERTVEELKKLKELPSAVFTEPCHFYASSSLAQGKKTDTALVAPDAGSGYSPDLE
jgi:hypothetical protein